MTVDPPHGAVELAPAKQLELRRALDLAAGETAPGTQGMPVGLLAQGILPASTVSPVSLPMSASASAPASLHIVRHRDTGCVQFEFAAPASATPALAPPTAATADRARWFSQAALRITDRLTQAAIEAIEAHSKPEGLLSLRHGYRQPATAAELAAARGQRVLLFVHGVFSSTEGAFLPLGDSGDGAATSVMAALVARYQGRVFGHDHWTIAKTPQQNALDLLGLIPAGAGWHVDIVCHSRGGLVVRALLADASARDGTAGATATHANDTSPPGDTALAAAAAELSRIAVLRAGRIASVGKVFYVAAANRGSPLASPADLHHFLNVAALLASFSAGMALDIVIGMARAVVSLGYGRPAVRALASGSALIRALDSRGTMAAPESTCYARANFDFGDSALSNAGDLLNRVLLDADSDLVVPYASVAPPGIVDEHARMLSFGTSSQKQSLVWHTEFFRQQAMRDFLLAELAGR